MDRIALLLPLISLCFNAGCGRSSSIGITATDNGLIFKDSGVSDSRRPDRGLKPDSGCSCPKNQVWLNGPCVPTMELNRCAPGCAPTSPQPCPKGMSCDRWAAAPFCLSHQALPACVPGPAMGFPPETLRLTPTSGVAGKPVTFSIQGGDFYVGALHWLVSFGDANSGPVNQGGSCTLRGAFTPPKPGVYAVTVGYGAKGQALAGFYTASGGSGPPKWVQPGFPCGSGNTCASASPYSCSCKQGRCRCSK